MSDVRIAKDGRAGRITLSRPQALNSLTFEMAGEIESAIDSWKSDPDVRVIMIDAEGEKAFCAGGDIAKFHEMGGAGNYGYGKRFWRDEYRLNAKLFEYPKPRVSFLQGYTMGGGVGLGCHCSSRVVCESSRIAMPECAIGLVPDAGGSYLLARAPGWTGTYLGCSGARMKADDAIHAGFADLIIPEAEWPALKSGIAKSGDPAALGEAARKPQTGELERRRGIIDRLFDKPGITGIMESLEAEADPFARETLETMRKNSPLSMACAVEMLRRLGKAGTMREALALEFRYTWRAQESSDFLEGTRARVIDKDNNPKWRHGEVSPLVEAEAREMLAPLGENELQMEDIA